MNYTALNKLTAEQRQAMFALYTSRYCGQFVLPTELVVDANNWNRPQLPQTGKYWSVDCETAALFGGNSEPRKSDRCTEYRYQTIVECFENYGDDGHTDMKLIGYVIGEQESLPELTSYDASNGYVQHPVGFDHFS